MIFLNERHDVNGMMTLSDPFCSIRVKNSRLSESVEQFQKTEVLKKTLGR